MNTHSRRPTAWLLSLSALALLAGATLPTGAFIAFGYFAVIAASALVAVVRRGR